MTIVQSGVLQDRKITELQVFKEIANRTGFVQYYGITGINRTSSLEQEYNFKYYSTDIGNYRTIYPQIPGFIWIRNNTIPSVTSYKWEWNFSVITPPFNYVSIFQLVIFSNDDNVRVYINDPNTPTITIPYNVGRSGLGVWTWNTVYYARIELDNSGGQMNALEMGVYYQFNQELIEIQNNSTSSSSSSSSPLPYDSSPIDSKPTDPTPLPVDDTIKY